MAATILLVDDEPKVLDVMKPYLEGEGFRVLTAANGTQALRMVEQHKPDLVVLDWMLPEMSGLEVCRAIRAQSSIGIIMLTARADEVDKILGLEVGADDYITKPFSLRELVARIRSVLRRAGGQQEGEHESVMVRGDLTIDEEKFRVWKGGQEVQLTPTEFKILVTLAANPGVVYSRLQLLQAAIGEAYLNYERTIDTHISHLRKKLEDDPANPVYIQTVYGIGYRFGEQ
ncbi:DNA-binding response regulator [Alicyclobacillus cellulosilyticus]|uniref:DNA-binding response regulator n=1 Tax=Alicyclobacillus cellulosilyticus TaxID=1003997 RepID=A0A917K1Y5_9BACL|nr:response regulator transcription factor [Alicyclobacillus cellulosilyticus]GGI97879.1 DNA-binding response regulator [Alicyclobacillus cellulosilyticus]